MNERDSPPLDRATPVEENDVVNVPQRPKV